ncbi:MAG: hypothetical protein NTZ74_01615 [Chloroflexi bacterium]|nr:hypothetical protein [Chloroflexota bacterium]
MKPISLMTQIELAAYVNDHLQKVGIRVILSGGAAVSYRYRKRCISFDLDLSNEFNIRRKVLSVSLHEIGFREEGRHYKHPESQWFVC